LRRGSVGIRAVALAILVALFLCVWPMAAQTAESLAGVKRVAVQWTGTDRGSAATRDRLVQKLKASGAVELVTSPARADGILHGDATVWVSEYLSTTPRSNAGQQAVYRGYASAEVTGKDGRTLWSYLVTPRSSGWKNITDDLGDQLAEELLSAFASKDATESVAGTASGAVRNAKKVELDGAGGTFPAPIYKKWFEGFERSRPEVQISYAAVGSEDGLRRLARGQVDFGASDMPLQREELNAPGQKWLQVATVLGAVVPIYDVKGVSGLNLSGEVLAGIFLGKIQRWNAPEIRAINKRVHLPNEAIVVVHRSDGSGTTFAWTDFLSKVSADWKSSVGAGTTVKWPVGTGADRNDGVAETVRKTPNSIGYVEFLYALQHELEFAAVRNGSGEFVRADLDSVMAAGKTAAMTDGSAFGVSITNARGKHVYPIATFTWLLIPENGRDAVKNAATRDLIRWMLTTGQKQCEGLGYAPLPAELAARELKATGP
jgi:phosphate transport system substrate-binding protein